MSYWTYVHGTVVVSPMGRTQAEKRYILETVLDHLPVVSGSEGPMDVYIIQKNGHTMSSSHTEFGVYEGFLKRESTLSTEVQSEYILVVDGSLRDRMFNQTFREFQKWLCRLAKRVDVQEVMVEIKAWGKSVMVRNPEIDQKVRYDTVYGQMFEDPTWVQAWSKKKKVGDMEPNWCEYLMWDRAKDYDYPMMLAYKYFNDEENDREVERRMRYLRGEE